MPSEPRGPRTPGPPPPPGAPGPAGGPPDLPPAPAGSRPPDFRAPRRLHPASVVLGIPLTQLIQILIVPVFAGAAGGGALSLGLFGVIGTVGLAARILDWHERRFSFDGEVLRVDHGVLSRNHRALDVARIQQVEIQRGAVQRLFGLAALRVETAGSANEPEVDLRVVTEQEAVALRAAVRASKAERDTRQDGSDTAGDGSHERPVLEVPLRHVVLASVTGAQLLVLPALIGGAMQFIGQQLGNLADRVVEELVDRGLTAPTELPGGPDWRLFALLGVALLALTLVAAVVVGVLRDGRFRIVRIDEDLHVSRGLLSTRDSVVPLRRVQLVEIRRNWLRRLLGYATVRIRSAGGSAEGDGRVSVPLLPLGDVDRLLSEVLPAVEGVPALRGHPPTALRRALFRWLRPALLLVAVAWLGPWALDVQDLAVVAPVRWITVALVPLAAALAVVEYRQLAHALTGSVVVSRRGALSISTTLAPVVKAQAVTSRRSFFQRRLELTTLVVDIAGPGATLEVLDADSEDARDLHERLTEHAASPEPVAGGPATAG